MLYDIEGKPFEVGCVVVGRVGGFRRVYDIKGDKFLTGSGWESIEKAEERFFWGAMWDKEEIKKHQLRIVAYRKLETPDSEGNVLRVHDWVDNSFEIATTKYEVLDEVISPRGVGWNWVIVKQRKNDCGIDYLYPHQITKTAPPQEDEWYTTKNGKRVSRVTVEEALREYLK